MGETGDMGGNVEYVAVRKLVVEKQSGGFLVLGVCCFVIEVGNPRC
jgi:hypothetical protein